MNIALFGVIKPNFGDQIILQTTEYLIKQIDEKANICVYNMLPNEKNMEGFKLPLLVRLLKEYNIFENLYRKLSFNAWKRYEKTAKVKSFYEKALHNVDAVIFAGGGIIKFSRENFWDSIYSIVHRCEEKKIPVYFNAVGVEGYDKNNFFCLVIKKYLNKKCIKKITTRDDLESLLLYVENHDKIGLVGDPAFWLNECYKNQIHTSKRDIVGIGVIRGKIFTDYGVNIPENEIIDLYLGIIRELEHRGYKWELYCNGGKMDYALAKIILEKLGLPDEYMAPKPTCAIELINIIKSYKTTISARLHANIVATALQIPTIGIVWNDKLKFFGEIIGCSNRFIEPKDFNNSKLIIDRMEEAMTKPYSIDIDSLKSSTKLALEDFIKECQHDTLLKRK
ncbi:polysaccharide pyruvyl transferase family protein [Campylobacter sp. 46490-21]|uniref:polysaccharide pyruvyl transferase family protein n=1 Tax=Campylobacter magnus TaxID=3026462 RepID=UPI0023621776|nr:polysaccharide pyruvyl transferase family protein [Campylobacter magnus]MDD0847616.1 polysaccharide pyruvyl transferase family protein [Campylobacter magnus]